MGRGRKSHAKKSTPHSKTKHAQPLSDPDEAKNEDGHTEDEITLPKVQTLRTGSARSSLALPLETKGGKQKGLSEDGSPITPADSERFDADFTNDSFMMPAATVAECQQDIARLDEAMQKMMIQQDETRRMTASLIEDHMTALSRHVTEQLQQIVADNRSNAPSIPERVSAAQSADPPTDSRASLAAQSARLPSTDPLAAQSARGQSLARNSAALSAESSEGPVPVEPASSLAADAGVPAAAAVDSAAQSAESAAESQPPAQPAAQSAGPLPQEQPQTRESVIDDSIISLIREQQAHIARLSRALAARDAAAKRPTMPDEFVQMKARLDAFCAETDEKMAETISPTNAESRMTDPLLSEKFKFFKTLNGWASLLGGPPDAASPFEATSAVGSNLSALEMSEAARARPPASFPSHAVTDKPGAPFQRIVFDPVNDRVEVLQRPPGGMPYSELMARQLGLKPPGADAEMDRVFRETLKLEANKGLNASPERLAATYNAIAALADIQRGLANAVTQLEQQWPKSGADQRRVLQVMQDYSLIARACVSTLFTAWALKGVADDRRHELLSSFKPMFSRNGIALGSSDYRNHIISAEEFTAQTFPSSFLNFFSGVPRGFGGPPPPASS